MSLANARPKPVLNSISLLFFVWNKPSLMQAAGHSVSFYHICFIFSWVYLSEHRLFRNDYHIWIRGASETKKGASSLALFESRKQKDLKANIFTELIISFEWRGKFNGIISTGKILTAHLTKTKKKKPKNYLHEPLEIHLSPHSIQ